MWSSKQPPEITALLIDGANAYHSALKVGYMLDYLRIRQYFKPQQSMYFTALPDRDKGHNNVHTMVDKVNYNGYVVISKLMQVYDNGADGIKTKGNMDVELAVHIMKCSRWANHIVLFSGDGDFRLAVEDAQQQGVRVTVVSALKVSGSPMISDILRRQANDFLDLADPRIKGEFEMSGRL
jgi:uncharacterized LabA/DUF88 family protein